MTTPMALHNYPLLVFTLLIISFTRVLSVNVFMKSTLIYPLNCSNNLQICSSYLYHISKGLEIEQIASSYSVNITQVKPITHGTKKDYLISVPCTCRDVKGTQGYFYDTFYKVQQGDTFFDVTSEFYSGQALKVAGEEEQFIAGNIVTIHLACGCMEGSQKVVTYTVQDQDTLTGIAELLSADLNKIESLNGRLTKNPGFIDVGWVLFVPMEKRRTHAPKEGIRHNWKIIIGILSCVISFSVGTLMLYLLKRNRTQGNREENPKAVINRTQGNREENPKALINRTSLENQHLKQDIEAATTFGSDRPVIFGLEEINKATSNFDETMKIGQGGYGSVYYGIIEEREVAIKKMKSNMSKEFIAELKVLCKIHHINVVELLGYASGDNHLYLVYEYVQNGSLTEHLHDPLLKGHQPLSWTARAHIAFDAARGIEYIHDHTKARYVHRDIKTSNILLDHGLRAKVADFGLARLIERSNEEDCVATRLVGTPGYLSPESVLELQMTSKTDVFAYGVVLAELITGKRALIRDNGEPNKTRSLALIMHAIFQDKEPETALEANIDGTLKGSCPVEDVYKVSIVGVMEIHPSTIGLWVAIQEKESNHHRCLCRSRKGKQIWKVMDSRWQKSLVSV